MPRSKKAVAAFEYGAATGSILSDDEARTIALFLNKHFPGGARPEEVVEAAKFADAPEELSSKFEWNDRKAAKLFRIHQARKILRSISVIIIDHGREVKTRGYHAIVPEGEPKKRYVPMQIVFSRPDYTSQVIENARQDMERWINRYESYRKLLVAVKAAKNVLSMIPTAP